MNWIINRDKEHMYFQQLQRIRIHGTLTVTQNTFTPTITKNQTTYTYCNENRCIEYTHRNIKRDKEQTYSNENE